jgi:hypothetical protein
MFLLPSEIHEMSIAVYEAELVKYELLQAENPPYLFCIAKPEKPVMPTLNRHWDMRKVVTGSRRNWKRG